MKITKLLKEEKNRQSQQKSKEIVEKIKEEFSRRSEERKSFEAQWQLNMNFVMGNQYCSITNNGEVEEYDKQFFWQEREVFNHIAELVDVRLAKLSSVRPKLNVVPVSADENDIKTANLSKKILDYASSNLRLSKLVSEATKWSEVCGTSFYKVVWNATAGDVIAKNENQKNISDGDVEVCVCPPFEIFPDSVTCQDIDDCKSIMHAKAVSVDDVKEKYGVNVEGEELSVFSLDNVGGIGGFGYNSNAKKITDAKRENYCLVIEYYERPTSLFPNGKLTIIAGNQLIYDGELPYVNGKNNQRAFPFIKQVSIPIAGSFWGTSVVERTIPIQRAYNAVKNRKHEFLNRLSMGVLTVEDGSVDIDNLEDEGLSPGKILVYRQGSTPPTYMSSGKVPTDFVQEEERLLNEFLLISGVSDLMRSTSSYSTSTSGTALQLLIEQDESRLSCTADSVKESIKSVGEQILRLYRQFAIFPKLIKVSGNKGEIELFYFSKSDISSDELVFETQNELTTSLTQRRNMLLELLNRGLLLDETGKMSNRMRSKALDYLGFGMWENSLDLTDLHSKKADEENIRLLKGENVDVVEIDEHSIHISSHTGFMLGKEFEQKVKIDKTLQEKFLKHIRLHKQMNAIELKANEQQIIGGKLWTKQ